MFADLRVRQHAYGVGSNVVFAGSACCMFPENRLTGGGLKQKQQQWTNGIFMLTIVVSKYRWHRLQRGNHRWIKSRSKRKTVAHPQGFVPWAHRISDDCNTPCHFGCASHAGQTLEPKRFRPIGRIPLEGMGLLKDAHENRSTRSRYYW